MPSVPDAALLIRPPGWARALAAGFVPVWLGVFLASDPDQELLLIGWVLLLLALLYLAWSSRVSAVRMCVAPLARAAFASSR